MFELVIMVAVRGRIDGWWSDPPTITHASLGRSESRKDETPPFIRRKAPVLLDGADIVIDGMTRPKTERSR
jgi:hypothetical protein